MCFIFEPGEFEIFFVIKLYPEYCKQLPSKESIREPIKPLKVPTNTICH